MDTSETIEIDKSLFDLLMKIKETNLETYLEKVVFPTVEKPKQRKKRNLSDEEKEKFVERMRKGREKKLVEKMEKMENKENEIKA